MQDEIDRPIKRIRDLDRGGKQQVFEAIKDGIAVHRLEDHFGISVQIICEAIMRAGDLTQRGIRGVIAETVFSMETVPKIVGWRDATPVGNHPYDVLLTNGQARVRVQVKMQRKQRGGPLMRPRVKRGPKEFYVVEVQRTRTGNRDGELTRPYRFSAFDLLAVCMQPSTGNWRNFLYVSINALQPKKDKTGSATSAGGEAIIETLQLVPPYPGTTDVNWTDRIEKALAQFE